MAVTAHYIQACTNGRLHDAREPSISPLNRGFLYGDAIYEVWRTYHGVIFAWEEHWRRLEQSATSLYLTLPLTAAAARVEIKHTVAAYQQVNHSAGELYIRLQVTRGGGPIGLDPAMADRSDYVLLVQPNTLYSPEKFRAGLNLSVATALRRNPPDSLNPAWKTGNYLNNILCLREARMRGADEVVIANLAGEVTEAAVSNIAFVRDGEVLTPPLRGGLLAGITRELLFREIAPRVGCRIREASVRPEDFARMDECFLLSTTKDITPVASIDTYRFTLGDGTLTLRLKAAFADYAKAYSEAHCELRVG
jgi:branched-subunit amino acid aminotransferase/4-amino-4-deoxychorismate lyase